MAKELENVFNGYVEALASQCWEAASIFFHENATVIFAEGTYHGKAAIGLAMRKTFSLIKDESFDAYDILWNLQSDEFASCTFNFKWSGTINGNRFTNPGRGTLVWIKENGQWLIINEHFGSMPR